MEPGSNIVVNSESEIAQAAVAIQCMYNTGNTPTTFNIHNSGLASDVIGIYVEPTPTGTLNNIEGHIDNFSTIGWVDPFGAP